MRIKKVCGHQFGYEVGKGDVAQIELTEHGSDTTTIYKVTDGNGELIVHAGFLEPYEIEYTESKPHEQITLFD